MQDTAESERKVMVEKALENKKKEKKGQEERAAIPASSSTLRASKKGTLTAATEDLVGKTWKRRVHDREEGG